MGHARHQPVLDNLAVVVVVLGKVVVLDMVVFVVLGKVVVVVLGKLSSLVAFYSFLVVLVNLAEKRITLIIDFVEN